MAAKRPRILRRASRTLLVCAVALAHLVVLLILPLSPPREPAAIPPPHETIAFLPIKPPRPREPPLPKLIKKRNKREQQAAAEPAPTRNAPAGPNWTLPPTGGGQGSGSRDLEDPYAVREALKSSVGCDQDWLKLRPDEQAHCADRTARWAKKGKKIGPAADDPKRQAELQAEEENNARWAKWHSEYGPIGMAKDAAPPRPVNHPTSALDDPLPH
jgi:hypothetical protein